jgi:hypothetical protein
MQHPEIPLTVAGDFDEYAPVGAGAGSVDATD